MVRFSTLILGFTIVLILFSGIYSIPSVLGDGTVDQSNLVSNTSVSIKSFGHGQQFTAGVTANLVSVDIFVNNNSCSDTWTVKIWQTAIVSGTLLSTTTGVAANSANFVSDSGLFSRHVELTSPVSLTSGQIYIIHVSGSGKCNWSVDSTSNPYGGGAAFIELADGSGVTLNISADFVFRTYTLSAGDPCAGNASPTANAGIDQNVNEGDTVNLSGTGADTDGSIASFNWLQKTGISVTLTGANTASPSFTAPPVSSDQILTFELTVTDNCDATGTDIVAITVKDTGGGMSSTIQDIRDEINASSDIDPEEEKKLTKKLDKAEKENDKENKDKACGALDKFIKVVDRLEKQEKIIQTTANSLRDIAESAKSLICG